ncbi:hypothetical protein [Nocardia wallacei]|uniref:hypothetical protein n=1 Tax=Nocardia wallacei TaxID=480035 RepID=UPI002457DD4A|nr:hypothetical protein [Nocardia wallacei]
MRITIETEVSPAAGSVMTTAARAGAGDVYDAGGSSAVAAADAMVGDSANGGPADMGAPPAWLVQEIERARAGTDTGSADAGPMMNDKG